MAGYNINKGNQDEKGKIYRNNSGKLITNPKHPDLTHFFKFKN